MDYNLHTTSRNPTLITLILAVMMTSFSSTIASAARKSLTIEQCSSLFSAKATVTKPKTPATKKPVLSRAVKADLEVLIQATFASESSKIPWKLRAHRENAVFLFRDQALNKDIEIEWRATENNDIVVESGPDRRTLVLPFGARFETLPEHGRPHLQLLLVGTEFHPFGLSRDVRLAYGIGMIYKASQIEAINAVRESEASGKNKFLLVAPTGFGKTEILLSFLRQRIQRSTATLEKVHFLIADMNGLVDQLARDVAQIQRTVPFELVQWGDGRKSEDIETLVAKAQSSRKPIVVVTTIHSLKAKIMLKTSNTNVAKLAALRKVLSSIVYDEAHHSGAKEAVVVIRHLIDHKDSKAFLYGTTATPIHRDTELMDLFGEQAFWAYLDTAASFRNGPREFNGSLIVDQLSQAVQRGELTPFNSMFILNEQNLKVDDLYITEDGRKSLDPVHYPVILKRISPLLLKRDTGFIVTSTIKEATRLSTALTQAFPKKRFAPVHSQIPKAERQDLLKDVESGQIQFPVTVRQFDEGINVPRWQVYLDFNNSVGPRQFLQRNGRVLRLSPGKEGVDLVGFMSINDISLKETILTLQEVLDRKLLGLVKKVGPRESTDQNPDAEIAEEHDMNLPEVPIAALSLSPTDIQAELDRLLESLQSFWQGRKGAKTNIDDPLTKHERYFDSKDVTEVAHAVAEFIIAHKHIPYADARDEVEQALYQRYRKWRSSPGFTKRAHRILVKKVSDSLHSNMSATERNEHLKAFIRMIPLESEWEQVDLFETLDTSLSSGTLAGNHRAIRTLLDLTEPVITKGLEGPSLHVARQTFTNAMDYDRKADKILDLVDIDQAILAAGSYTSLLEKEKSPPTNRASTQEYLHHLNRINLLRSVEKNLETDPIYKNVLSPKVYQLIQDHLRTKKDSEVSSI